VSLCAQRHGTDEHTARPRTLQYSHIAFSNAACVPVRADVTLTTAARATVEQVMQSAHLGMRTHLLV
jgi:hypothetical protein